MEAFFFFLFLSDFCTFKSYFFTFIFACLELVLGSDGKV